MARGWESKGIADQVEQAHKRKLNDYPPAEESTPAMRARRERLESLKLSRARTLHQLECATNRAYREMLERALAALNTEIKEFE